MKLATKYANNAFLSQRKDSTTSEGNGGSVFVNDANLSSNTNIYRSFNCGHDNNIISSLYLGRSGIHGDNGRYVPRSPGPETFAPALPRIRPTTNFNDTELPTGSEIEIETNTEKVSGRANAAGNDDQISQGNNENVKPSSTVLSSVRLSPNNVGCSISHASRSTSTRGSANIDTHNAIDRSRVDDGNVDNTSDSINYSGKVTDDELYEQLQLGPRSRFSQFFRGLIHTDEIPLIKKPVRKHKTKKFSDTSSINSDDENKDNSSSDDDMDKNGNDDTNKNEKKDDSKKKKKKKKNDGGNALVPIIENGFIHQISDPKLRQMMFDRDPDSISGIVKSMNEQFGELGKWQGSFSSSGAKFNSSNNNNKDNESNNQCPLTYFPPGYQHHSQDDNTYALHTNLINRYLTDPRFIVVFDEINDLTYPRLWSLQHKLAGTLLYSVASMLAQLGSGITAPLVDEMVMEYQVSSLWVAVGSTMYFVGTAFGPMLFGPFSEMYGRKLPFVLGMAVGTLMIVLCSNCKSFGFYLTYRLLWGLSVSSPIVIASSAIADLWYPKQRATFLALNSLAIILGPTSACMFSTALRMLVSWRWVVAVNGILTFVVMIAILGCAEETYHPTLLSRKAKLLRRKTGNQLYRSEHDQKSYTTRELVRVQLLRPIQLLTTPIVFVICMYNGFAFGLYFMVSIHVPKSFEKILDMDVLASSAFPFTIFIGAFIGACFHLVLSNIYRERIIRRGESCQPEARLFVPLVVGWLMPLGMIIFGWGVDVARSWELGCFGLVLVGAGFFVILQGCLNYLCDAYPKEAASCIAANSLSRSMFACALPLVSPEMFHKLGLKWGSTILGVIGFTLTLFVLVIFKCGAKIRASTK